MKPLAHTPATMPGSGIREIVNLAVAMPGVIRLEVGEPNVPTPRHIAEAGGNFVRVPLAAETGPLIEGVRRLCRFATEFEGRRKLVPR